MLDKQAIKQLMVLHEIKVSDLAQLLGMNPRTLSNKLYRGRMSCAEVARIVTALDGDLIIRSRKNGQEYILTVPDEDTDGNK